MSGKKLAKAIKNDLAAKVVKAKEATNGQVPGLAVVMVSGNEDSEKYVGKKVKAAKKVGIQSETHRFDSVDKDVAVLEEQLVDQIKSTIHKDICLFLDLILHAGHSEPRSEHFVRLFLHQ
jgi:5,10-methylene-tetrahydrofolate dehydrogenase/methenyl tetrahydrofolate cyclohydrolase